VDPELVVQPQVEILIFLDKAVVVVLVAAKAEILL
jgi:hypothetical protein